jgi:hypothetical protein
LDKEIKGGIGNYRFSIYLAQSRAENNANKICKTIGERCNGVERQNVFSNIREKISLVFYCDIKHEWGKKS